MKIIIPIMQYYPSEAIGANRWNNLSMLLANEFKVEIWTVKRKLDTKDIHRNIKIKNFICDPMVFLVDLKVNNFILKILKKIIIRFLSILFWPTDMGEYFSLFIEKELLKEMKNNSLFIITGGSFALQSKIFKFILEKNYKHFILDYRDVWNTDPHRFYLFNFIKKRAENIEKKMMLSNNGKKIFVTNTLAKNMICKPNNYEVILNGHDIKMKKLSEFKEIFLRKKDIKRIKIIYLGSIGKGRDLLFIEFIKKLNNSKLILEIDIYGSISINLRNTLTNFKSNNLKIRNFNKVNRSKIMKISKDYNLALQITSNSYPYALSTKLYEYPALCLPQICICNEGEIKEIIIKNKIGIIVNSLSTKIEIEDKLNKILNQINHEDLFKFAKQSTWDRRSQELSKVISKLYLKC